MYFNVNELVKIKKDKNKESEKYDVYNNDTLIVRKVIDKNFLGLSHLGIIEVYFLVPVENVERILRKG